MQGVLIEMKCAILIAVLSAPLVASAGPSVSTKTTGLYPSKACKTKIAGDEGSDPVLTCPAMKGYAVEVSFSATNTLVTITGGAQEVTFNGGVGAKLEWQLSGGKPFAVLVEVADLDTDDEGQPKRVSPRVEIAALAASQRSKVAIAGKASADRKKAWKEARAIAKSFLAPAK